MKSFILKSIKIIFLFLINIFLSLVITFSIFQAFPKLNEGSIYDKQLSHLRQNGKIYTTDKDINSKDIKYKDNVSIPNQQELETQLSIRKKEYSRGFISIPSIELKLPIYEGTSNHTLSIGAGTMKPNQIMGKGNYSISAHNFVGLDKLGFTKLQLKNEARDLKNKNIYMTDGQNIYQYIVSDNFKVDKSESMNYIKDNFKNEGTLTLYTCLIPSGITINNDGTINTTERIIVKANLFKEDKFKNWDIDIQKLFADELKINQSSPNEDLIDEHNTDIEEKKFQNSNKKLINDIKIIFNSLLFKLILLSLFIIEIIIYLSLKFKK